MAFKDTLSKLIDGRDKQPSESDMVARIRGAVAGPNVALATSANDGEGTPMKKLSDRVSKLRGSISRPAVAIEPTTPPTPPTTPTPVVEDPKVTIANLQAQVAELEGKLREALAHPDLSQMSEDDLSVMASDAARSILGIARTQGEQAAAQAAEILANAREEASRLILEAKTEATTTRETAEADVRKLRESAERDIAGDRAQLNAEIAEEREDVQKESARILEKAKLDAREIEALAIKRRAALYDEIEDQRNQLMSTLEDAARIQQLFTEGYLHMRKAIEESVGNLVQPVMLARRQITHLEREIADRPSLEEMSSLAERNDDN